MNMAMSVNEPAAYDEQQKLDLEALEIKLLTEGIYHHYGFDFRDYSLPSLKRRVWERGYAGGLAAIAGLLAGVLHDPARAERPLLGPFINTTALFPDPSFFLPLPPKNLPPP